MSHGVSEGSAFSARLNTLFLTIKSPQAKLADTDPCHGTPTMVHFQPPELASTDSHVPCRGHWGSAQSSWSGRLPSLKRQHATGHVHCTSAQAMFAPSSHKQYVELCMLELLLNNHFINHHLCAPELYVSKESKRGIGVSSFETYHHMIITCVDTCVYVVICFTPSSLSLAPLLLSSKLYVLC